MDHGRLVEEQRRVEEVWGKSVQKGENCCKGGEGASWKRVYDMFQEEAAVVARRMGEVEQLLLC